MFIRIVSIVLVVKGSNKCLVCISSFSESASETKILRKDGISEHEQMLYLEASKIHGNDWHGISRFILKNGQSLPKAVYQKYQEASSNEGKMKSIKSRIGNIRKNKVSQYSNL